MNSYSSFFSFAKAVIQLFLRDNILLLIFVLLSIQFKDSPTNQNSKIIEMKSVQRIISAVHTPTKNVNSPSMSNALLLEPGRWELYDPFLLCAEDWFQYPGGFDDHPHRGFEVRSK
jgi:hypothetical protein